MGFQVGQKYRTNALSFTKGGVTVEVEKINGTRLEYNNVKNPQAYIRALMRNSDVLRAWVKE